MSKPPPIAFMSYARKDDTNSNNGITRFHRYLSQELELATGEEFRIYQDWKDIGWGQDWKEQIDKSLDDVIFLIPIITPLFLKSKNCRDEVEHFISREKELNRKDLILPVYFMDCPEMNDQSKNASDPIIKKIKEHQWADWRELRHESFDSRQVKINLAKLAKQIRIALDRVAPDKLKKPDIPEENSKKTILNHTQRIVEPLPDKIKFLEPIMKITNRDIISRIPPDGTRIRFRFRERNYETRLNSVKYKYRTLNSLFTSKFKVAIDIWIHLKELYFNDEDGWHPLKILRR